VAHVDNLERWKKLDKILGAAERWEKIEKIILAGFFATAGFLLITIYILGPIFEGELAIPEFPPAAVVLAFTLAGSLFILRRRRK
jgi:hypothetical protein